MYKCCYCSKYYASTRGLKSHQNTTCKMNPNKRVSDESPKMLSHSGSSQSLLSPNSNKRSLVDVESESTNEEVVAFSLHSDVKALLCQNKPNIIEDHVKPFLVSKLKGKELPLKKLRAVVEDNLAVNANKTTELDTKIENALSELDEEVIKEVRKDIKDLQKQPMDFLRQESKIHAIFIDVVQRIEHVSCPDVIAWETLFDILSDEIKKNISIRRGDDL